ncbi:MAG: NAD-dependent epimerase/dehydratase family protein [Saprospiraceae bacterium]
MIPPQSKILITGGTGFVGSHIVRHLIYLGYDNIVCIKRSESSTALLGDTKDRVQWLDGDLLDLIFLEDALQGVDTVIHAAAIVSYSNLDKKKMLQTAMDGTAYLINAALSNKIKKFIHISSVAAIGRTKPVETIDESFIFSHSKYDTSYGLAKYLAEQEVWRGHAEGLNVTVLNPSTVLGAGFWNQTSLQLFSKVYRGMKLYPGGATGWVNVWDVSQAVINSILQDHNGERFIISGENISYQKILETVSNHLSIPPPTKKVPMRWSPLLWRIEAWRAYLSGTKPTITKETIMSSSVCSQYDTTKSVKVLKMQYRSIDASLRVACHLFMTTYPKDVHWAISDFENP